MLGQLGSDGMCARWLLYPPKILRCARWRLTRGMAGLVVPGCCFSIDAIGLSVRAGWRRAFASAAKPPEGASLCVPGGDVFALSRVTPFSLSRLSLCAGARCVCGPLRLPLAAGGSVLRTLLFGWEGAGKEIGEYKQ